MSDISSFAEWEAQQLDTEGNIPTERQQKLIDMASEYRIWVDRDSSNDYRSSASEDEEEGWVELPVNRGKIMNGETVGRVRVGLGMGHGLKGDLEIPGSMVEESQWLSQRAARGAEDEVAVSWAFAIL
jgi:hypothetical protein